MASNAVWRISTWPRTATPASAASAPRIRSAWTDGPMPRSRSAWKSAWTSCGATWTPAASASATRSSIASGSPPPRKRIRSPSRVERLVPTDSDERRRGRDEVDEEARRRTHLTRRRPRSRRPSDAWAPGKAEGSSRQLSYGTSAAWSKSPGREPSRRAAVARHDHLVDRGRVGGAALDDLEAAELGAEAAGRVADHVDEPGPRVAGVAARSGRCCRRRARTARRTC